MTRRILSTAALAAFLASGHPLIPPAAEHDQRRQAATAQAPPARGAVLDLAGRMLAVDVLRRQATTLDVALQLEGPPVPVRLWTGPKNAWGSAVALALPQAGLPGFLRAAVTLRPGSDRLWVGVDRDGLRPAIGAVRLDGAA